MGSAYIVLVALGQNHKGRTATARLASCVQASTLPLISSMCSLCREGYQITTFAGGCISSNTLRQHVLEPPGHKQ